MRDQLKELSERAGRVDQLVEQNEQLRNALAARVPLASAQDSAVIQHDLSSSATNASLALNKQNQSTVPYEEHRRITEKYEELSKIHERTTRQAVQSRVSYEEEIKSHQYTREEAARYKGLYEVLGKKHENMKKQGALWKSMAEEWRSKCENYKNTYRAWFKYLEERYGEGASKIPRDTSAPDEVVDEFRALEYPSSVVKLSSLNDRMIPRSAHAVLEVGQHIIPPPTVLESALDGTVERDGLLARSNDLEPDQDILSEPNVHAKASVSKRGLFENRLTASPHVKKPTNEYEKYPSSETIRDDAFHGSTVFTPRLHHLSSQTTDDEFGSKEPITTLTKPALVRERSSSPVLVSTRTLKRKMMGDQRAVTVDVVQGIKSEGHSSTTGWVARPQVNHNDSLDLDELEGNVETPRKRRHLLLLEATQKRLASQRPGRYMSVPVEASTGFTVEAVTPRLTSSFNQASNQSEVKVEDSHDEPVITSKRALRPNRGSSAMKGEKRRTDSGALRPLDVNNQILPRTSVSKPTPKRRDRATSEAIQEVAEDGEAVGSRLPVPDDTTTKLKRGPARIEGLLETPSMVNKHTLLSRSAHLSRSISASGLRASKQRRNPAAEAAAVTEGYSIDDVRPAQEPLRARPLHRLCVDDFKVNPRINQGYDFAFTESVRKKDLRHCLPGCTRPECCGDVFRKMAELGGPIATPNAGRRFWDSSSQEDGNNGGGSVNTNYIDKHSEERRLLLNYLGNDTARLARLTSAEKAEMVIRIRAQDLAQRHGKHRQAYARAASPPGFWRADMPTTQETEEDKERARGLERERVKTRYEEAMKPGGRWMFRDE